MSNLLVLLDALESKGDDGYRLKRIRELADFYHLSYRSLAELRRKEKQRLLLLDLKREFDLALIIYRPLHPPVESLPKIREDWEHRLRRCARNACIRYNEPEEVVWDWIYSDYDANPSRWRAHVDALRQLYDLVRGNRVTRKEACQLLHWSRQRLDAVFRTGHKYRLIRERAGALECWQRLDWDSRESYEAHRDYTAELFDRLYPPEYNYYPYSGDLYPPGYRRF